MLHSLSFRGSELKTDTVFVSTVNIIILISTEAKVANSKTQKQPNTFTDHHLVPFKKKWTHLHQPEHIPGDRSFSVSISLAQRSKWPSFREM